MHKEHTHSNSIKFTLFSVAVRHVMVIAVGEVTKLFEAGVEANQGLIGATQHLKVVIFVILELCYLVDDFHHGSQPLHVATLVVIVLLILIAIFIAIVILIFAIFLDVSDSLSV